MRLDCRFHGKRVKEDFLVLELALNTSKSSYLQSIFANENCAREQLDLSNRGVHFYCRFHVLGMNERLFSVGAICDFYLIARL